MYNQKTSEMMFMDFNKSANVHMFITGAGDGAKTTRGSVFLPIATGVSR